MSTKYLGKYYNREEQELEWHIAFPVFFYLINGSKRYEGEMVTY